MQIYLYQNEQQAGPYSEEDIRGLVTSGAIAETDLGWHEGMAQWQPINTFLQFALASAVPVRRIPTPPEEPLILVPQRKSHSITHEPRTQKCPFCAEQISVEAKKCKHCGETIDVALRAAEESKRSQANQPMVFMNAGGSAVSNEKHRFPHGMHLILTILTAGGWSIIWVLHYLFRNRRYYY